MPVRTKLWGLAMLMLFVPVAARSTPLCAKQPLSDAGVVAAEQDWIHALEARDVAALSCLLSAQFRDTNWQGKLISRKEILASIKDREPPILAISELSVIRYGRLAVVSGMNTQTSKDPQRSGSVRFTDVFEYRDGAWHARSAQETLVVAHE